MTHSLEETFKNINKDAEIATLKHRCMQFQQLLRDLHVVICEDEDLEEAQAMLKELFGDDVADEEET